MKRLIILTCAAALLGLSTAQAQEAPASQAPAAPEAPTAPVPAAPKLQPAAPLPTAAVPETPAEEAPAPRERYGRTDGFAYPFTFGPSFTLISAPAPFKVALESKYSDLFGGQVSYGFLPKLTIGQASAEINSWDARLRWFPFRKRFFLGMAMGGLTVKASKADTINGTPVTANIELSNTFYAPHIGWRFCWPRGFFFGIDLGWQFAKNPKTTFTSNAPTAIQTTAQYVDLKGDVEKTGNDLGSKGLPMLTLLSFGWLF